MRCLCSSLFCLLSCFYILTSGVYGGLMTEDDEDLAPGVHALQTFLIEEKYQGVTYLNDKFRPFPANRRGIKIEYPFKLDLTTHLELLYKQKAENVKTESKEDQTDTKIETNNEPTPSQIENIRTAPLSELHEIWNTENTPEAAYQIGKHYQEGRNEEGMDFKQAFTFFSYAADMGHSGAQGEMGFMYDTGKGVERNEEKALLYYSFAAKGNDPFASLVMGYRYSKGVGVAPSCSASAKFYRAVGDQVVKNVSKNDNNDPSLYIDVVDLVEYEESGEVEEQEEILEYMEFSANTGDDVFQTQVGLIHLNGLFKRPVNYESAHFYLHEAYEQGNPRATALLGGLYEKGYYVEQNNKTAIEFYEKSIQMGSAQGHFFMGRAYANGMGVEQNFALALHHYSSASNSSLVDAMVEEGKLYYNGWGVDYDYKKAFLLFNRAAIHGNIEGKFLMAKMQHHGLGTAEKCSTALTWYKSVAEKGDWFASYETAFEAFIDGNYDIALLRYEKLAVGGLKIAQANAAFMFENRLHTDDYLPASWTSLDAAIFYYDLASKQGHSHSHLRLGDLFYDEENVESLLLAAAHYRAITKFDANALYNMGYMYQYGVGMKRDLPLAAAYFQEMINSHDEAYLGGYIALLHVGYQYVCEKISNGNAADLLPEMWEYLFFPSVFTEFLDQLELDLQELEKELEEEAKKSGEDGIYDDFLFLEEDVFGLGYSLEDILIVLLCVSITVILLFQQGIVQVQVARVHPQPLQRPQ